MSGIAGIFHFDERPVDCLTLTCATNRLTNRGPDTAGHWTYGPVGFGHRMLHTTPESLLEDQPLTNENGTLCLTMDGRVDNRDELRVQLESKGFQLRTDTDAELTLRAYECWGETCPVRIIGDFAFAIWDGNKHQLFCARDALGVRPFYYYTGDGFFAFASDPSALFALPRVERKLRLDALADYLLNNLYDSAPTEFERLFRLRPAHCLTATSRTIQIRQYWDVDTNAVLQWKRPEQYEEAFQDVFTTAVQARLRGDGKVGVVLSGGLDSSSIHCWIEDLRAQGKLNVDLQGYTAVFDGQRYDESRYLHAIEERWGTEVHYSRPQPPAPLWSLPEACRADAQPAYLPLAYLLQTVFELARNDGRRILLAGPGGDDFMDAPTNLAASLLATGHPAQAVEYTLALARFHSVSLRRAAMLCLIRPMLSRLLPRRAKDLYKKARPDNSFLWLRDPFRQSALERRRNGPWFLKDKNLNDPGRQSAYSAVHLGHRIRALECWDRLAAAAGGVELRHPFLDRRLVEFACVVPDTIMAQGGQPKGLLRAALSTRLPELIRYRNDKADFAALINEKLIYTDTRAAEALLDRSRLEQLGLVDGDLARRAYHGYRATYGKRVAAKEAVTVPWTLLSLEGWLREEQFTNGHHCERDGIWIPEGAGVRQPPAISKA